MRFLYSFNGLELFYTAPQSNQDRDVAHSGILGGHLESFSHLITLNPLDGFIFALFTFVSTLVALPRVFSSFLTSVQLLVEGKFAINLKRHVVNAYCFECCERNNYLYSCGLLYGAQFPGLVSTDHTCAIPLIILETSW